ncbi:hypothetical protein OGATHE_006092 [Ogataea polymorpha]|uniref:Uncharacterized protein n=1 Tax=Ogataea polymorpha TaxID=460523 RepID=A0A9P8SYM5_9ASCO|nr:hypothetical protein OGATHE_006092 [Ogataea polymorpha]
MVDTSFSSFAAPNSLHFLSMAQILFSIADAKFDTTSCIKAWKFALVNMVRYGMINEFHSLMKLSMTSEVELRARISEEIR